ncbi:17-beta-hydroxysteroid dehydrogenase [Lophiotrema nucula]|uniref:17-beta-hydroxysteroid dehydrogenase n=1 Tax=Lophiotrema nucula TaxID=690887 RepID=A0A6A5YYR9_9PLEO|nr:17-beta-hydroxysteroid dehydrogenase [Lophiotrema nucula]
MLQRCCRLRLLNSVSKYLKGYLYSTSAPHSPNRLDGKAALVTGSGCGIGAATAVELGRLGARVVVNYANSVESAAKTVNEIQNLGLDVVVFKADVRQVPQTVKLFDDAVKVFGGLDIGCSNSGVVGFGHLGDVTEEEFDHVFSLDTRGQFFVAREAYRHLNEGGRISLMSSNTAKDFTVPNHSLYSGSKGAIDSFVLNTVAPGTVADMFHDVSQHYILNGENYTAEERQQEAEWVNDKIITLYGGAA